MGVIINNKSKNTFWRKGIAIFTIIAFTFTSIPCIEEAHALAVWAGMQRITVNLSMLDKAYLEGKAEFTDPDDPALEGSIVALKSRGKILLSNEVAGEDAVLKRRRLTAVFNAEIKAVLEIIARQDGSKYQAIVDKLFLDKKILGSYAHLFPEDSRPDLAESLRGENHREMLANDMIARAFEILLLEKSNAIHRLSLTGEERDFIENIERFIRENENDFFTGIFWDQYAREINIRIAMANGQKGSPSKGDSSKAEKASLGYDRDKFYDYVKKNGINFYPGLKKIFTPLIINVLLRDEALKPVYLQVVPAEHLGPLEVTGPQMVSGANTRTLLENYSVFNVGGPEIAERLVLEGKNIVVGVVDQKGKDLLDTVSGVANGRQAYIPLSDGSWLGIKGAGQFNFEEDPPFFLGTRPASEGRYEGLAWKQEAEAAKKNTPVLRTSGARVVQYLGSRRIYAAPDGEGGFTTTNGLIDKRVNFTEPVLIFNRVMTPHRVSKLPHMLETDPGLRSMSERMSKALKGAGDIPEEMDLSPDKLILLMASEWGKLEAKKQNLSIFKKTSHSQDLTFAGEEADMEEMCGPTEYREYLTHISSIYRIEQLLELFDNYGLDVYGMRAKLSTLVSMERYVREYRPDSEYDILFPDTLKVLETLFKSYFSSLDDKWLGPWHELNPDHGSKFDISCPLALASAVNNASLDPFHPFFREAIKNGEPSPLTSENAHNEILEMIVAWAKEEAAKRPQKGTKKKKIPGETDETTFFEMSPKGDIELNRKLTVNEHYSDLDHSYLHDISQELIDRTDPYHSTKQKELPLKVLLIGCGRGNIPFDLIYQYKKRITLTIAEKEDLLYKTPEELMEHSVAHLDEDKAREYLDRLRSQHIKLDLDGGIQLADGSYDVVIIDEFALGYVKNKAFAISEMIRVCADGGVIYCSPKGAHILVGEETLTFGEYFARKMDPNIDSLEMGGFGPVPRDKRTSNWLKISKTPGLKFPELELVRSEPRTMHSDNTRLDVPFWNTYYKVPEDVPTQEKELQERTEKKRKDKSGLALIPLMLSLVGGSTIFTVTTLSANGAISLVIGLTITIGLAAIAGLSAILYHLWRTSNEVLSKDFSAFAKQKLQDSSGKELAPEDVFELYAGTERLKILIAQKLEKEHEKPVTVLIKSLSGSGKSTVRRSLSQWLKKSGHKVEIVEARKYGPRRWEEGVKSFRGLKEKYSTSDVILIEGVKMLPLDEENLDIYARVVVSNERIRKSRLKARARREIAWWNPAKRFREVKGNMAAEEDADLRKPDIIIDNSERNADRHLASRFYDRSGNVLVKYLAIITAISIGLLSVGGLVHYALERSQEAQKRRIELLAGFDIHRKYEFSSEQKMFEWLSTIPRKIEIGMTYFTKEDGTLQVFVTAIGDAHSVQTPNMKRTIHTHPAGAGILEQVPSLADILKALDEHENIIVLAEGRVVKLTRNEAEALTPFARILKEADAKVVETLKKKGALNPHTREMLRKEVLDRIIFDKISSWEVFDLGAGTVDASFYNPNAWGYMVPLFGFDLVEFENGKYSDFWNYDKALLQKLEDFKKKGDELYEEFEKRAESIIQEKYEHEFGSINNRGGNVLLKLLPVIAAAGAVILLSGCTPASAGIAIGKVVLGVLAFLKWTIISLIVAGTLISIADKIFVSPIRAKLKTSKLPIEIGADAKNKKVIIIYYSGSGGTKRIAEETQKHLSKYFETVDLEDAELGVPYNMGEYDIPIFFYPCFYLKPANPILEFIDQMEKYDTPRQGYAFVTMAAFTMNTMRIFINKLEEKNIYAGDYAHFRAPATDCSIVLFPSKWIKFIFSYMIPSSLVYGYEPGVKEKIARISGSIISSSGSKSIKLKIPPLKWYTLIMAPIQKYVFDGLTAENFPLYVDEEKCEGLEKCGMCINGCARKAWTKKENSIHGEFHPEKCPFDFKCVHHCPHKAIFLKGKEALMDDNPRLSPEFHKDLADKVFEEDYVGPKQYKLMDTLIKSFIAAIVVTLVIGFLGVPFFKASLAITLALNLTLRILSRRIEPLKEIIPETLPENNDDHVAPGERKTIILTDDERAALRTLVELIKTRKEQIFELIGSGTWEELCMLCPATRNEIFNYLEDNDSDAFRILRKSIGVEPANVFSYFKSNAISAPTKMPRVDLTNALMGIATAAEMTQLDEENFTKTIRDEMTPGSLTRDVFANILKLLNAASSRGEITVVKLDEIMASRLDTPYLVDVEKTFASVDQPMDTSEAGGKDPVLPHTYGPKNDFTPAKIEAPLIATVAENKKEELSHEELLEKLWSDFYRSVNMLLGSLVSDYKKREDELTKALGKDQDSAQSLILYADDLLKNASVIDLESTIKKITSDNGILNGGKIIIFTRAEEEKASAIILENMIKRVSGNIETIRVTEEELIDRNLIVKGAKEIDKVDALVRFASSKNAKNILALIKGPSGSMKENSPEKLVERSCKLKVPVIILGLEDALYSLASALQQAIIIKGQNGTHGWVVSLLPIRTITEDIEAQYQEYQRTLQTLIAA